MNFRVVGQIFNNLPICRDIIYAQVNADFSATPTTGWAPVFVQFTDLSASSAGNIVSWSWDLGGGSTASVQSPGKAFTSGGQFTICLTVTDDQGNTDTECKTNYLDIFSSPQAQISASGTAGCSPYQVNFTNNSTSGSGAINLIQWAFGDGNSGSGTPISNTYTNAGMYNVTLSVSDVNGCSDVLTIPNYITVQDLGIVDFIANQTENCVAPFTVNFSDLTNPNPNFSYLWDFGDGNTSTQQNPTHTYTTVANFNVSLTVTDNVTACTKTKVKNNYISINNVVSFTYPPAAGCEPFDVTFTNTTPGNTSNWLWDFGDGFTSTQENPTHTFQTDGCFFVTLTLDRNGCTSSFISPTCIQVNDAPQPTYTINGSNLACSIPHALSFTGTSNLVSSTFFWDFGDGNTSTQQNPSHTYITFGEFPVAFTAISSQGCSTTVVTDTVKVLPVNADFSIDSVSGCTPLSVTFSDESFSLIPITSYNWNITGGPFSGTFTTQDPLIILTDTAVYNMTLTVINSQGCSDNTTISSIVKVGMPPVIDFEAMDTVLCVEDDAIFTNLTSTFTDNYDWDFGDGNTSVATNPTTMYQDTGYFDVKLLAEHNGCVSELEKEGYIQIQPAKADYTVNRDCNQPYTIAFLSTSIGAERFHWDFGVLTATNDTSDLENPVFTFPNRGSYLVVLTAINDSTGCSHDYSETIIVTDPISNFTFSSDSGCAPLNINIGNSSTDASTYLWNVPGAVISDPTSGSPTITFNSAGVYTEYELIITDVNSCNDTINFNDTIQVYDVYPVINTTQLSCPNTPIPFTDASTASDGTITNWLWDFGNGQTSTLQNPSASYLTQDTFAVSLTATSSLGCSRTFMDSTFMIISQPNVDFSTLDTFVCAGQDVNFVNNSDAQGRQTMSYLWDFGDGNTSNDTAAVHQYQNEGLYTVCLTVTDSSGCDSTYCIADLIEVVNPHSDFAADTTFASCPILVPTFSDSSTNSVSWSWDFGDGLGTSTQQNPSYTYVTSGNFDVQLVVTDVNGCTDTLVKPSYINIDGPYGDFTPSTLNACPNDPVTFTGNGFNTTRYIWDFGDGNFVINQSSDTTNLQTYAYPNGGTYYPLLILEGSQGCIEVYPSFVPLIVDNVDAQIIASDTTLCDTATISFLPNFISNLPIDSFYWSFDGAAPNSTDTFPNVFFDVPGIYTVELHVFNSDCSNFGTLDISIGRNPQANFAALPTIGCTPQLVNLQNSSSNINSYPSDSIISWDWDFGHLGAGDSLRNTNYTYADSGDYNIQLIVGTISGCFDTTSVPIRVNLTPIASAGADKTMCLQSAVQLDGSGIGTYQWSPIADLDDPNIANPVATPSQTTTYTLTVTSPEGCIDTSEMTVTVIQQIAAQVSTSNDTTICEGDVIQLFAFGGANVLQYSWDTAQTALTCYESCSNPFANPTTTTTYYVTLYTSQTCFDMDSIEVTVVNQDQDILGNDLTICEGDSAQLMANIGVNPIFSPSNNISCVFCPDPFVFPTTTSDYIVETTTSLGCQIQDTITINVISPDDVNAGEDIGTCVGNTVNLGGNAIGIISWTGDSTINNPSILNPSVSPIVTTDYILTVQNGNCLLTDTVSVIIVESATLEDGEFTICTNDPTEIGVEGFAAAYEWSPADGLDDATAKKPIATLSETTIFNVTGTIPGCPSDDATVTVNVIDVSTIIPEPIQNVFEGTATPINLTSDAQNPNLEFLWTPNLGISCTDCNTPNVTLSSNQTYHVQITDTENGCIGQDSVEMKIVASCNENLIVVPNAFSPNGDGLNDVLYVRGSTLDFIYNFRIYSRSGELVFETTDMNDGWDGIHNGEKVNSGVFVYYVEAPCALNGSIITKSGNVTVIK